MATLRSRPTASSGMCHIASMQAAARRIRIFVYLATRGCQCSLVGPCRVPDLLVGLVLRLSLQSGNETKDPLKSGPAKAGTSQTGDAASD